MNTNEVATFEARVQRFMARGLGIEQAEALADSLTLCDRNGDKRTLCLECGFLQALPENHWPSGKRAVQDC